MMVSRADVRKFVIIFLIVLTVALALYVGINRILVKKIEHQRVPRSDPGARIVNT
ncbi:MAG: hypothetical protein WCG78_06240 [Candidatus Omnitrophota bacterium]